jgi:hypothetical protein
MNQIYFLSEKKGPFNPHLDQRIKIIDYKDILNSRRKGFQYSFSMAHLFLESL